MTSPSVMPGRRRITAGAPAATTSALAAFRFAAWIATAATVVVFAAKTAPLGFNPTDEGLVQAMSARLLRGQTPHADFVFSRPAATPLLHAWELLVPRPFLVGRLVSTAELLLATVLLVATTCNRRVRDLPPVAVLVSGAAWIINLHTFPMFAWYTVDGILICSAAWWLLRSRRHEPIGAATTSGLLLVGLAPLTKQSFAPFAALALVWFVTGAVGSPRSRSLRALRVSPGRLRRTCLATGIAAMPGVAYLVWVGSAGGLDDMLTQFAGAGSVETSFGQELLTTLTTQPVGLVTVVATGLLITATLLAGQVRRGARDNLHLLGVSASALLAGVLVCSASFLELSGAYGVIAWWMAAATCVVVRGPDRTNALMLLVLAWSSMLSFGYKSPNLLAGSLLVVAALPLARNVRDRFPPLLAPAEPAIALIVLVALTAFSMDAHTRSVYRDLPADRLTAQLGTVDPTGAGIVTNDVTASFLRELRRCSGDAPRNATVLVLPGGAAAYPLFGWKNPIGIAGCFPMTSQVLRPASRQTFGES